MFLAALLSSDFNISEIADIKHPPPFFVPNSRVKSQNLAVDPWVRNTVAECALSFERINRGFGPT